jgi:hypothetical protein
MVVADEEVPIQNPESVSKNMEWDLVQDEETTEGCENLNNREELYVIFLFNTKS